MWIQQSLYVYSGGPHSLHACPRQCRLDHSWHLNQPPKLEWDWWFYLRLVAFLSGRGINSGADGGSHFPPPHLESRGMEVRRDPLIPSLCLDFTVHPGYLLHGLGQQFKCDHVCKAPAWHSICTVNITPLFCMSLF